jgi:hypothetical protein
MMRSNMPTMLQREDFQSRHSDMLAAALCEPLTKRQIEEERFIGELLVSSKVTRVYMDITAIPVRTKLPEYAWRRHDYGD